MAERRARTLATEAGVEPAAIDYVWHPTTYTNDATRAVLGDEAVPPAFDDYVEGLVAFARNHPEIDATAMV